MKKAIKISIPEPCHEDWNKMTPTEKGKFCSVCTKEVFDFTQTTDEELVKKVIQGKNLCGRFKKSQLDREIKLERKSGNSLLPYAASLLMPLSMMATEAKSTPNTLEKPFTSLGIGSRSVNPIKSVIQVSGFVRDQHFNPIKNATLYVLETGKSVKTNAQGYYNFKCSSGSTIEVQKEGMITQKIQVGAKNETINFSLFPEIELQFSVVGRISIPSVSIEEIPMGDIEVIEEIQQDSTKITIKGTVTDVSNLSLPGVNVIVKGTTNGTQTDFDGNYSIEVEPNDTLLFSYVGFESKEILTSNIANTINVIMEDNNITLGGAVMYCIVEKSNMDFIPNPYESISYFDEEQKVRSEERRAYSEKENAFKKVKAARAKAARLLKRNSKNNK